MAWRIFIATASILATHLFTVPASAADAFRDVLDLPAQPSAMAASALLTGVTRAGERLVAVGQRGHILYSDDAGNSWKQSKVPVSSDLTAVYFPSPRNGWAVGHDGVVLASRDAGLTWQLQTDGRRLNDILLAHLQRKTSGGKARERDAELLAEAERMKEQGPDKPFLDVWFADDSTGYIVGAYNLIFRTADGGKTWEPWFDRTDNPRLLHIYGIRPVAGALYAVGESGLMMKLDRDQQRFVALNSPYAGSFFGVLDDGGSVLAYGMRGNVWRSNDGGASWKQLETGLSSSIVSSAALTDGALALVGQAGQVLARSGREAGLHLIAMGKPFPFTSVAEAGKGVLVLVGQRGVKIAVITTPVAKK